MLAGAPASDGGGAGVVDSTGGNPVCEPGARSCQGAALLACDPDGQWVATGGSCVDCNYTYMIVLPSGFCMDPTEVTRADYENFLRSNPPQSTLAACRDNDLSPGCGWPGFDEAFEKMQNGEEDYDYFAVNRPATCVDWCDAVAFCAKYDKHLCGSHGGNAVNFDSFANPTESLWSMACTSAGANDYPYGDEYVPGRCVDSAPDQGTSPSEPDAIGRQFGCTGTESMFQCFDDLSGNVAEWENSCDSSELNAQCHVRGGSYLDQGEDVSCSANASRDRMDNTDPTVGFRCCKSTCPP